MLKLNKFVLMVAFILSSSAVAANEPYSEETNFVAACFMQERSKMDAKNFDATFEAVWEYHLEAGYYPMVMNYADSLVSAKVRKNNSLARKTFMEAYASSYENTNGFRPTDSQLNAVADCYYD